MSRSRLVDIIHHRLPADRQERVFNGTMAYESAADEIVFVVGPFIVGLLATTLNPAAPVIGAALLTLFFVSAFALHPSGATRSFLVEDMGSATASAPKQAPAAELFRFSLLVIVVGAFGMGLFFGSTLTALTSFLQDRGHPEQAGLIYGVMGIGSTILALGMAWFSPRFTLRARGMVFALLLVVATSGLVFVGNVIQIAVILFVVGFGVGPSLVVQYSVGAERSPRGRSATVMTMLGSALILGEALSAAVVGTLAQALGTGVALLMPFLSALIVFAAASTNWFVSGRAPGSIR